MKIHDNWWAPLVIDPVAAQKLALDGGLFLPVANYLVNRHITTREEATRFLEPDYEQLLEHPSFGMMDQAVTVILEGLKENKQFLIYGDYDVDGITSTAILGDYLKQLGARVNTFIPHRIDEGYGLSFEALESIDAVYDILITVDCGITSVQEVAHLLAEGKQVIVTDHHEPGAELPAGITVNPKTDSRACQGLAGVGVVFLLLVKLQESTRKPLSPDALALSAIGTIADLMPLEGLNRVLVFHGLRQIPKVEKPGLKALFKVKGLDPSLASATDIAFKIAPVLNASGRLDTAMKALTLLQTEDESQALLLAGELNALNEERKDLEKAMKDLALHLADPEQEIIIVAHESFHEGIVGIVASRLTESLSKPALVFSDKGAYLKGSGRSVGEFNLLKALDGAGEWILQYGGHRYAAGLKVEKRAFESFKQAIGAYARRHMAPEDRVKKYYYTARVGPREINREMVDQIEGLGPFGIGNPRPAVLIEGARIEALGRVGPSGEHLKIKFLMQQRVMDAIGFNLGHRCDTLRRSMAVDLIGTLRINRYLGVETLNLELKDIREAGARFILQQKGYYDYIESHVGILKRYHQDQHRIDYFTYEYFSDRRISKAEDLETVNYHRVGKIRFEELADLKHPPYQAAFEGVFMAGLPDREDLVGFYKGLKKTGLMTLEPKREDVEGAVALNRTRICAGILEELKLVALEASADGESLVVRPLRESVKTDLKKSQIYRNIVQIKEDWHEFKRKNQGD
ncbi:MAG: hypothetical protein AVO33_02465 [delta proteobacterium ML8_F1]|nr:MAG: hypothetical protein AVO33_02465 [delta proteobacterium ML8_F1]